jgi:putative redox protein
MSKKICLKKFNFKMFFRGPCITKKNLLSFTKKINFNVKKMDKSKELTATVTLLNNKLHFNGIIGNNDPVSIDYTPPLGDNLGYTSLELLLLSLSSCVGSSVLTFLRKMKKTITHFNIESHGIRRETHPTGFTKIDLIFNINSDDVTEADLTQVIKLSEETYCPVWAMLKNNVDVVVKYNIMPAIKV